jgi:hypothetical protein
MKKAAYSDREIMETKIARLFKEAMNGGLYLLILILHICSTFPQVL